MQQVIGRNSCNITLKPKDHDPPTDSTCTSCTYSDDFSNYWTANLYFKAKNGTFTHRRGAPTHTDTFDLKFISGVTPAAFNPTNINGIQWPVGLLPKLAVQLPNIAIVRSMRAWALVHTLAQTWTQIGRNPAAVLGDVAPNIGSVVALEKDKERTPGQVFPTFIALNSGNGVGNGYFSASYAPFRIGEPNNGNANAAGLANTTNPDGQARNELRYGQLHAMDDILRVSSPYGKSMNDMNNFYSAAHGLQYNAAVNAAFGYTAADSLRYGGTSFGNACLVAKQVLGSNQGTRFVQITLGGWDMHSQIYTGTNLNPAVPNNLGATLDNGVAALLADLEASGQLNDTLVVMVGEFGRTVGALSGAGGRDHFLQQFVFFAGGGVRGGRAIGSTNSTGSASLDYGWSQQRDVKPEDVEATIYSALGIDWTTVRHDDPLGRGFEYVPFSGQGIYAPINELWM